MLMLSLSAAHSSDTSANDCEVTNNIMMDSAEETVKKGGKRSSVEGRR